MTVKPYNEELADAISHLAGQFDDKGHYSDSENLFKAADYLRSITKLEQLLLSARDILHHSTCVDGDATKCPGCSLENLIDNIL